jgi:hypothetical protein
MAKALQPLDVSDLPELLRLAEEVRMSGMPRLLKRGDQEVAILAPPEPATRRDRRSTNPSDPLWQIIGIGDAVGAPDDPTDVSENRYRVPAPWEA